MMANNEIGTVEPIEELARIAHAHGALIHTDVNCQGSRVSAAERLQTIPEIHPELYQQRLHPAQAEESHDDHNQVPVYQPLFYGIC